MAKKILVVEDNLDMRELVHLYLTREGFTVFTASDGREGLYLATAERPDLIITDINMPHINGLELVRQLRAQSEFKNLPILVFTPFGFVERDNAISAGATRAIDKPMDFESLINDVKEMLAGRNHR